MRPLPPSTPPPHRTVQVRHPSGRTVDIDENIAPLIADLWQRRVGTSQSCEASAPGTVWIAFPDSDNALRFLARVGVSEGSDDDLSHRALMLCAPASPKAERSVDTMLWRHA
jgi:hypothetical protein